MFLFCYKLKNQVDVKLQTCIKNFDTTWKITRCMKKGWEIDFLAISWLFEGCCPSWWCKIPKCIKRLLLTMWMGQLNSDQQRQNAKPIKLAGFFSTTCPETQAETYISLYSSREFKIRNGFLWPNLNLYWLRDCCCVADV